MPKLNKSVAIILYALLVWISIFDLCKCGSKDQEREDIIGGTEEVQTFLDNLLYEITTNYEKHKLDPVILPDTQNTFKEKVAFIPLTGGFVTNNGKLYGLSTLHRSGEVFVSWDHGETVQLEADLSANDLNVSTDARAYFGAITSSFFMSARVRHLRAKIAVELPISPGGSPRVTSFDIREVGTISLDFRRLGPLNVVLEGIGYVFLNALRQVIKSAVAHTVKVEINKEISKMRLPDLTSYI